MTSNSIEVARVEILGNDGVHEWGRTHYKDGCVLKWVENLKARRELEAAIRRSLSEGGQ